MNTIFDERAKWISDGSRFVAESDAVGSPALYLSRRVRLKKTETARVTMCGLGLFELSINGRKVSDRVLEPAFTQYDKRALYTVFEVAEYLLEGENDFLVVLGDGWYNQTTRDTWGFYRAAWRDCPKMIFQLETDGEFVYSDGNWLVGHGPVVSNALRAGETYDARISVQTDRPAQIVAPPGGVLSPQTLPPIRECERLFPVSVTEGEGYTLYDFGKNIAGYCSGSFSGERGARAELVHSDRLTDGRCDNASNGMYIFNPEVKYQTDTVIVGDKETFFKPKFVYHGFRYVEVRGDARVRGLTAHFVHTDLKRTGDFRCSDERLNDLHSMSLNAILSNYHGFPTDCPHREKNGWTGDAQLTEETCVYHFDMREAYKKWLSDFADNQRGSGQISAIVPSCGWGYNWGSGPAWDFALFQLTRALDFYYEEHDFAREMFPVLEKYLRYAKTYEKDGLVCYGLGDWNYPKNVSFAVCPTELTDSCYYLEMLRTAAGLAPENAETYAAQAEKTARAIAEKYAHETSLTGLAALTSSGIIDKGQEIAAYLEQNDCAPHCGILGMRFLVLSLLKMKRSDLSYRLLTRAEYPSFGYWAAHGQTALCEDFELTNSLNHPMYSCITELMTKGFCGVLLGRGRKSARIEPQIPAPISWFSCSFAGFSVQYRKEEGETFEIFVPLGRKAVFVREGTETPLHCGNNKLVF